MKKLFTPLVFVLILSVMMLCPSCNPNNTPKTFTVTYDANEGKGTLEPAQKTEKVAIVIADANSLSREGYAFSGWNTEKDGTGTSYAPGDRYEEDADLTLYAQWKTLSFVLGTGGSYYIVECRFKTIISCVIPSVFNKTPVKSISEECFKGCTQLYSITIPESITTIGHSAFQDCTSLSSIKLPEGITTINHSTFLGCSALESIYLPKTLKKIDMYAFKGCRNLKDIYYDGTLTEWEKIEKDTLWWDETGIKYTLHFNNGTILRP